jgi:hypothetical protein
MPRGLLPLIVFSLNHVQPTSHAPPATVSVNQGVTIVLKRCLPRAHRQQISGTIRIDMFQLTGGKKIMK